MAQQFHHHISSCVRALQSSSNPGLFNHCFRWGVGGSSSKSFTSMSHCAASRHAFLRQPTANHLQETKYVLMCTSQYRQSLPAFRNCVNNCRNSVLSQTCMYSTSSRGVRDLLHSRLLSRRLTERYKEFQVLGREKRTLASEKASNSNTNGSGNTPKPATEEQLTLYQRFKKTYKEHGVVLVGVHLATSAVWFGMFYTAAKLGVDIVPYLESWNLSERIITPFKSGGLGDIALAYLLYKLATPARYTVTLGGTNLVIKFLRKGGKMKHIAKEDTLRAMYKEGKANLRTRRDNRMTRMRNRFNKSRLGRLKLRQKALRERNKKQ